MHASCNGSAVAKETPQTTTVTRDLRTNAAHHARVAHSARTGVSMPATGKSLYVALGWITLTDKHNEAANIAGALQSAAREISRVSLKCLEKQTSLE